jgi:hypothetical protein
MFATVTTWRLAESVQLPDAQDRFLREMTAGAIGIVRDRGVLDVVIVEVEPDLLIVVSSYETLEDAQASGPPLLRYITERFSDRIELISRSIGPAFEPSQFVDIEETAVRQWRDEATAMYARISYTRLDPSIREPDAFMTYLAGFADEVMAMLSRLGLLDVLLVRISDDTLMSLRLFEDPVAFDAAMREAWRTASPDLTAGKVEILEQVRGRAFDATQLLSS